MNFQTIFHKALHTPQFTLQIQTTHFVDWSSIVKFIADH